MAWAQWPTDVLLLSGSDADQHARCRWQRTRPHHAADGKHAPERIMQCATFDTFRRYCDARRSRRTTRSRCDTVRARGTEQNRTGTTCCNTAQHAATQHNMLQHSTTCCNTAHDGVTQRNTLQHRTTCCNTVQHCCARGTERNDGPRRSAGRRGSAAGKAHGVGRQAECACFHCEC